MSDILVVENLSKNFSGLKAVSDVGFTVREGSITGMIGSNGAGKTTCFNMISGQLIPSGGRVIYKGQNITGSNPYKYSSMGIARTFQIMKPLKNMTLLDNVISGVLFGRENISNANQARDRALEIMEFTGLYEKRDLYPKEIGTAYKKRLELARALATKPDLLLLDEVMAGLNPTETDDAVELVRKINNKGITVLLIEHVMRAVANLCEEVIVMHHGEKITEGTPKEVMNDPYVIEIYLGKEDA